MRLLGEGGAGDLLGNPTGDGPIDQIRSTMPPEQVLQVPKHVKYIQDLDTVR